MSFFKKVAAAQIPPNIETKSLSKLADKTGNIYQSLAIISKRGAQINANMKEELQAKLSEFASATDNLEEVMENREQIEISRFYERLPHPVLIAMEEFFEDEIYYRINPPVEEASTKSVAREPERLGK